MEQQPLTLEERINALFCARDVLEGTAGGYSPQEKMKAKLVIMRMFADTVQEYQKQNDTSANNT